MLANLDCKVIAKMHFSTLLKVKHIGGAGAHGAGAHDECAPAPPICRSVFTTG
jgi:hypothetical protein